jgi:hypothetical protein
MFVHHLVDQVEVRRPDRVERALVDVDRPLGDRWRVHRHVPRQLEPAEERAHQRHHGRVARGARYRQVEGQVELQEEVLVAEEVGLARELGLTVDRLLHCGEVVFTRMHCGQLRDARLEQSPRLEDTGDLADAHLPSNLHKIARHQLAADEDPAGLAAADLEHACVHQRLDGLADGRPADLHLRREIAFGGQPVARMEVAGTQLVGDLLQSLLERAPGRYRLELPFHRQRVYGGACAQATAASPRERRSRRARSTRSSA